MVLILSWNVAGLSSTVHRICKYYQPPPQSSSSANTTTAAATTTPSQVLEQQHESSADFSQDDEILQDFDDDDPTTVLHDDKDIDSKIHDNRNEHNHVVEGMTNKNKRNYHHISQSLSTSFISSSSNDRQQPPQPPPKHSKQQQVQHPSASICYYFSQLHHADIICIQEHKISKSTLSNRLEQNQCSTLRYVINNNNKSVGNNSTQNNSNDNDNNIIEYESFWSCCIDNKYKGFNGVVTYVKKGMVLKANGTTILGHPELDNQGRCIMTDHGTFLLYNVYVPNTSGQSLTYKMKFLNALRRSMQYQRTIQHKPIILVGDLNISHTMNDIYWEDRVISIDDIMNEVSIYNNNNNIHNNNNDNHNHINDEQKIELPQWKFDIANHWSIIESVLKTQQVIGTQTTNSITKEKYIKYRLAVDVPITTSSLLSSSSITSVGDEYQKTNTIAPIKKSTKRVFLGSYKNDPKYCTYCYNFKSTTYYDEDLQKDVISRQQNIIPIGILNELMYKIVNVTWSIDIQRSIECVENISPTRQWLNNLLNEDRMIDTFRYYYPNAQSRFTCWNQHTNQRYSNIGARIDYMLIDKVLIPYLLKGNTTSIVNDVSYTHSEKDTKDDISFLRCGCMKKNNKKKDMSTDRKNEYSMNDPEIISHEVHRQHHHQQKSICNEEAALCAATAGGKYIPASFDGGGIIDATQDVLDIQFNGIPHTGHIYTPPTFSDHIAISTFLSDDIMTMEQRTLVLQNNDTSTKKAQPHKLQTSIATFFSSSSSNNNVQTIDTIENKNKKKHVFGTSIHSSPPLLSSSPSSLLKSSVQKTKTLSNTVANVKKGSTTTGSKTRSTSASRNRPNPSTKGSILHHFKAK